MHVYLNIKTDRSNYTIVTSSPIQIRAISYNEYQDPQNWANPLRITQVKNPSIIYDDLKPRMSLET